MINKTYKNLILHGLGIIAILMFGVTFVNPEKAEADHDEDPQISVDGYGYDRERRISRSTNQRDDGTEIIVDGYGYNRARTFPTSNIQEDDGTSIAIGGYGYDTGRAVNSNANDTSDLTPVIFSISPNGLKSGSKETTISIYGANFTKDTIAKWNSSDRQTIFINSSNLAMTLSEEDLAGSGEYLVNVLNRATGEYSNAVPFTLGGDANGAMGSTTETNGSDLGANALFGAGGFIPFSLLDWILFFILILVGIILWRKVYLTKEKKDAPLKHA